MGSRRSLVRLVGWFILLICCMGLIGCKAIGTMVDQRYDRPLAEDPLFSDSRSARVFVPNTIPQTELSPNDPSLTGTTLEHNFVSSIPVAVTQDLVTQGKDRYEIYCMVCHGMDGHGDGKAVEFGFPAPPDLLGDNAKSLLDGEIFTIIENGKNTMLPYGYRVKANDRWAIIAYIRAMQLKGGHLTGDLTATELQQLGD